MVKAVFPWTHLHLPIASCQIKCGDVLGWSNFFQDIFDSWHGIGIKFGYLVDFAVIHTEANITIFFLNQDNR